MSRKLRVGLIGAGWPSWQQMKGYQRIEGVEVAALCDRDPKRLQAIADEYNVPNRYTAYEEMLEKERLDAVSVCSPNALHAEMSMKAMKKGAHVLCEKPMASSSKMAREMVKVSKATNRILMIGYQRRHGNDAQYIKRQISRGRLGDIYFVRAYWVRRCGIPGLGGWFTNKKLSGGGALIDIGVHVLDLGLWFMGYPDVRELTSSWGSKFGTKGLGAMAGNWRAAKKKGAFDVDDYAVAHMTFGKGRSLILQATWATHIKQDEMNIEIWGEKGGARLNPTEIFTTEDGVLETIAPRLRDRWPFEPQMEHFVQCIRRNKKPLSPAEEGVKTVEIIERIYAAAT
ncbi:MAG: gfo/Idh/MocA family oxidoreductase [Chitinivibrionales bacterium]|nr:gfo/Idh/MocA family oxidoreductase [Chitinivibrionales bacterium]MBD3396410.1 gfo/Idh/MocA family oxidoreductase [Chitinivibrionales bacterium]